MKKAIISFAVALILVPSISFAATPPNMAALEAHKIQIMEQLIVLLKAQIEQLVAILAQRQMVLGVSTTTLTSSPTTTTETTVPIVKKKRSGGGGGGGSSHSNPPPEPLVLDMTALENHFTISANYPLDPQFITVTLNQAPEYTEIPTVLSLHSAVSDGSFQDIELTKVPNELAYTVDMRARLGAGLSFIGEFDVVFPDALLPEVFEYTTYWDGNGVTRTTSMTNPGLIGDDLNFMQSAENPDAMTFALDEDEKVEYGIFAFDLSTVESVGYVTLNQISINVTVGTFASGSNLDTLVNDFRIEVDGVSYDAEPYVGTGSSALITFDINGELAILRNQTVAVVLFADFNSMDSVDEGSTIVASASASGISTIEPITVDGGTVTGDTHTLRVSGAFSEATDESVSMQENSDFTTEDNSGIFTIEFDVTGFGTDLYIDDSAVQGTNLGIEGVNYLMMTTDGATTSGSAVASVSSTASNEGGRYLVSEGETESFTLTVEYDPVSSASYRMQLHSLNFKNINGDPDTQQLTIPVEDYRTSNLVILN